MPRKNKQKKYRGGDDECDPDRDAYLRQESERAARRRRRNERRSSTEQPQPEPSTSSAIAAYVPERRDAAMQVAVFSTWLMYMVSYAFVFVVIFTSLLRPSVIRSLRYLGWSFLNLFFEMPTEEEQEPEPEQDLDPDIEEE